MVKVSSSLTRPPHPTYTKLRSFKLFAKLNANHILMSNFSKLRKYQTFGFIELHNLSKGQLADTIFKLTKSSVYDYRAVKFFWNSKFLIFPTFKQFLSKILWKNFQVSKYVLKVLKKVLLLHQYLWSGISRQWNNGPLNFLWNL